MLHHSSSANAFVKSGVCDLLMISKTQNKHGRRCSLSSNRTLIPKDSRICFSFGGGGVPLPSRGDILAQLCVDGQHLWVAHKGERQDGDGVGRLKMNPDRSP